MVLTNRHPYVNQIFSFFSAGRFASDWLFSEDHFLKLMRPTRAQNQLSSKHRQGTKKCVQTFSSATKPRVQSGGVSPRRPEAAEISKIRIAKGQADF
jgi:hypothetical protein